MDPRDFERLIRSTNARGFSSEAKTPAKQFIIGSVRPDGSLSFAERPIVHSTEDSARKEVERLAKANAGKQYVYLEIKGAAKSVDVQWATNF